MPITGSPQAMASSAARPNDSAFEGSRKSFPTGRIVSIEGTLPRKVVRSSNPPSVASRSASDRSGPSPISSSRAGISRRTRSKIPEHVGDALDRPEVGYVHEDALLLAAERPRVGGRLARAEEIAVHEVGDDLDPAAHSELAHRHVPQVARDGGDGVALLDPVPRDRQVGAVLADDRDVGAVEGRQDLQAHAVSGAHLAGEDGGDGVRQRVVHVQQVELRVRGHLGHLRRERQRVGGRDEERVARRDDLVEEDAGPRQPQPRGEGVGDEMDLVAPLRPARCPSSVATTPLPPNVG